ncbi:ATP-grasp ribosomal peptide maturase [Natronosporangium hydrolyticum]|uniref:ATP-grasp ribosomal peptide maturase n=1 Tax=Natronosporangium hydrolyticum TaxID=2811111 RepID=A0A895YJ25_9ACTN|nr:ATP-grasp ribosomal peptide maturase [Natronosporangium hydrolyticum]QSB14596.1 ATP-grasp ribosomal peptide maturase [Natronosporangium hydrolyticum]
MTVLVLTEQIDPTADQVIALLNQREVPVLRADTSWFPKCLQVAGEMVNGEWVGQIRTQHRQVALSDVRAIWYRHPTGFEFPEGMSAAERRHAAYEAKFGLAGVLWSLPVQWVNHPARQADLYKPTQLAVASRCGLTVPDTLLTNRPDVVRRFAAHHPAGVVVKQLGFASIAEEGGRRALYTHLLSGHDLEDLAGVEHTMHYFQAYIPKTHDVRLIAVGPHQFAVAILSGSDTSRVDFRADYASLSYSVVPIPYQVAKGVEAFMDHFRISYGAFDFAADSDGCWWMLECNSVGQYAWLEDATGLPMSAAVADLLEKGPS